MNYVNHPMIPDDEVDILAKMRAARAKARGYADFFGWGTNRDLEEWSVVSSLSESLEADGALFFSDLKPRGRRNDPPDCEALTASGSRIAIEVTELVDENSIRAFKKSQVYDWAVWSKEKFLSVLIARIAGKDTRYPYLKEPPYDGGYIVVVHTDEPLLSLNLVEKFLEDHKFNKVEYVDRVFLLLSYDPVVERCPYFELGFDG